VQVEVTTWYLEMRSRAELCAAGAPEDGTNVHVVRAEVPSPEFSRYLYTAVGGQWYWLGRLDWDYGQWQAFVDRPELETLVLYVAGTPAGYVEMERQAEANVEITCFGLVPGFIGRRLGRYLLSAGVEYAFQTGAQRVWLHTCNLDGPTALANYRARGFRLYDTRTKTEELPEVSPGPWPNAHPPLSGHNATS
jgi:ribosomal protein S18 acetylase RimI-like enzyme